MEKVNELLPKINDLFKKYGGEDIPIKLFHVRNEDNQIKDVWNDFLIFVDKDNNVYKSLGTTDPGNNSYIKHISGAAHMCLGLHRDIWVIDIHAANNKMFAHEALCNRPQYGCSPVKYWRDLNKNRIYDIGDVLSNDYVGINCHRASRYNIQKNIGLYSEGCQVRVDSKDHEFMMKSLKLFDVVKKSWNGKRYTFKFSCLLIDKKEIDL